MNYKIYLSFLRWLFKQIRQIGNEELMRKKNERKPKLENVSKVSRQHEPIVEHGAMPPGLRSDSDESISPKVAKGSSAENQVVKTESVPDLPALSLDRPLHSPARTESFPQTFVIESFFVRELITILTRGLNEEMHFLTGPKIGPIRIVSRWARPPSLDEQSPVFVRATAKSVADVLIPIIEQGAELHICAHSHPGGGLGATTPSGTDIECLGKLQRSGSQAIGCIVTRDGHVRFFSVSTNFHAMVLGSGVKEITKNVFHIAP